MLYGLLQIIFGLLFKLVFRAEIIGRENMPKEGAVILAANHMSNWDPPFVATFLSRPVSYMAKIELFKNPIFGRAITSCHAFPVKRGAADRGAIKAAIQVLKQGRCLGLFPEGTRSRTGKMRKAEAGVGLIASMTGAPVVPAAIIGTDKIFANGGYFPKLKVIYGEPMVFSGDHKDKEQLEAFSQAIMDKIAEMKEKNR
ncbi:MULTISPECIES: lysophospholipid acyltransferase family protein [Selenomonas]|uniref:1-acyl-sn-glycerol-3-phosphate acyltransferase n=1 Tax=Selenomonas ruminis TaxID=2593411 RepID=A0A5D6WDB2_9FIRM|nr:MULTISPECIES: lysophospholipid acyltransferase family protein [unclassified Selenomonas]MBQ1868725.1 1-acyl-sn-glycerol-3-phosphate acyltransferase [Selenomonas sp.]TYZ24969.1 1-acyl-sn-glycerol-3-phosphate acyltransferase [Selenomonas sp. mPRGC5]